MTNKSDPGAEGGKTILLFSLVCVDLIKQMTTDDCPSPSGRCPYPTVDRPTERMDLAVGSYWQLLDATRPRPPSHAVDTVRVPRSRIDRETGKLAGRAFDGRSEVPTDKLTRSWSAGQHGPTSGRFRVLRRHRGAASWPRVPLLPAWLADWLHVMLVDARSRCQTDEVAHTVTWFEWPTAEQQAKKRSLRIRVPVRVENTIQKNQRVLRFSILNITRASTN